MLDQKKIAVILPCLNEAQAIEKVIHDFRRSIPECEIHVFDNQSTDDTRELAAQAGATVHLVQRRGKGHVVQAMFRDVDADIYVLADGDGTYPAEEAESMIKLLLQADADLIIGNRLGNYKSSQSRKNHLFGNLMLSKTVSKLFAADVNDLLSGYRVMSRRYVKTMPLFSKGFEVETAMTIHAIEVGAKLLEWPINYLPRVEGAESKLRTWRDGSKIMKEIFYLYKDHAPRIIYFIFSCIFVFLGLIAGLPVVVEFWQTGLVPKLPRAVLASGLVTIAFFTGFTGIILNSVAKVRREMKKLAFLTIG